MLIDFIKFLNVFMINYINPPPYTCSDSHVRSAYIWLDTQYISVHLYDKYTILVT